MNVPATLLLAIPRNSRITRTHSFPFDSFWNCVRCDVVRCGVFGCIAWRLFPILWTHYRLKTANKFNGNVNAWKLVCHFGDRRKMPSILVASIRNLIWQAPCAHNDTKENTTDDLLVVQERATWGLRPKKQSNSIPLFDTQTHCRGPYECAPTVAYAFKHILVLIDVVVVVVVFHFLAQKWRHKFPSNNVNFTSDSLYIYMYFFSFFLSLLIFTFYFIRWGGDIRRKYTFGHSQTQRPALLLCERNWMAIPDWLLWAHWNIFTCDKT